MEIAQFIDGLRRQNTNALGFIPMQGLLRQYIANEQYLIQTNRGGLPVGYLLHGVPKPGTILRITQECIEYDFRERGFGNLLIEALIDRAKQRNCKAISLKCAEDLQANTFWQAVGFKHVHTLHPDNWRNRAINVYVMDLWQRLLD